MNQKQKVDFVKKNYYHLQNAEICKKLGIHENTLRRWARRLGLSAKNGGGQNKMTVPLSELKERNKTQDQHKQYEKNIKELLQENKKLSQLVSVIEEKTPYKPVSIQRVGNTTRGEAVAFALASDWHLEQKVDRMKINEDNEYNLEIAEHRAREFFQHTLKLVRKEQQDVNIGTLVLWLGGDFITGNIHTENLKICLLGSAQAVCFARDLLISGIRFLLDNSELKLVIPYNHGNHARITDKVWKSGEEDNSLEYILYDDIRKFFENEKRITMVPPRGSIATVTVYGKKIGFVHGHHGFRYVDGVGGLYIPARKYIMRKFSDYYLVCMGHYHQYLQDSYFICNGSMIGYDQYADSMGFKFDRPKQTFFLIDSSRDGGYPTRTITTPILFTK